MELVNVSDYLSKLLSLPESAIIEDGVLTSLCLMELNSTIEIPAGFFLTEAVRIPEYGEYFLDIKALVESDRLVVYKAIGNLSSIGLILESESEADYYIDGLSDGIDDVQFGSGDTFFSSPWPEKSSTSENGFNWALCELHGGCALLNGKKIELLSNYIDPYGVVSGIMVDSKKLVLTSVSGLENLPLDHGTTDDLATPLSALLKNILQPASEKEAHHIKNQNRMNLKFKGTPPNLDDLLNDLF
jgi:hypothetical protein